MPPPPQKKKEKKNNGSTVPKLNRKIVLRGKIIL
jgi:hypothetical protein